MEAQQRQILADLQSEHGQFLQAQQASLDDQEEIYAATVMPVQAARYTPANQRYIPASKDDRDKIKGLKGVGKSLGKKEHGQNKEKKD